MLNVVQVGFKFKVQSTARFFDRAVAQQLDPVLKRYLMRAGADIRKVARRSLKIHKRRLSELSPDEKARYRAEQRRYKEGLRPEKPQLPRQRGGSKPGDPPFLHFTPNPLRDGSKGVVFSLDDGGEAVVVGPSPYGDRAAEKIEDRNPFMSRALSIITPRLPAMLERAANK